MKKIILLLPFLVLCGVINAQITSNQTCVKASQIGEVLHDIDEVIVYKGVIKNSTSITFTYSYTTPTTIKWYRYTTTPILTPTYELLSDYATSSTLVLPTAATPGYPPAENGDKCGYVIQYEDGLETKYMYIWVIDLMNQLMAVNNIVANNDGVDPCVSTHLMVNLMCDDIEYYSKLGVKHTIPQKYLITYNSLDSLNRPTTVSIEKSNLINGENNFTVPAPYKETKFTVKPNQFERILDPSKSYTSLIDYFPVAVQSNLKAMVSERDGLNEIDRSKGVLGGSAPLDVDFSSNSNKPVAQYFEWYISNKADSADLVYYTDEDLRYTFPKSGLYKIKLRVSNPTCSVNDSIDATILESFMEIPNVFTPNGDGKNDEFRVAYKSIVQFKGIIYNRWGRKVFEWTDPGKGWDGRIGNRIAQPGAYYYIIEAKGSDIDPLTNQLKTYIMKGDINLLRGK